jgi:hypothetical protein
LGPHLKTTLRMLCKVEHSRIKVMRVYLNHLP